jgi:hypothetical protein
MTLKHSSGSVTFENLIFYDKNQIFLKKNKFTSSDINIKFSINLIKVVN